MFVVFAGESLVSWGYNVVHGDDLAVKLLSVNDALDDACAPDVLRAPNVDELSHLDVVEPGYPKLLFVLEIFLSFSLSSVEVRGFFRVVEIFDDTGNRFLLLNKAVHSFTAGEHLLASYLNSANDAVLIRANYWS